MALRNPIHAGQNEWDDPAEPLPAQTGTLPPVTDVYGAEAMGWAQEWPASLTLSVSLPGVTPARETRKAA